jgi:hypothetical protein
LGQLADLDQQVLDLADTIQRAVDRLLAVQQFGRIQRRGKKGRIAFFRSD